MMPNRQIGTRLCLPPSHTRAHHGTGVFTAVWQRHIVSYLFITRPAEKLHGVGHPDARVERALLIEPIEFFKNPPATDPEFGIDLELLQ
jgi:hypothetical protein